MDLVEPSSRGLVWLFFSLRGRLSLGRFWVASLVLNVLAIGAVVAAVYYGWGLDTDFSAALDPTTNFVSLDGMVDGPTILLVSWAVSLLYVPLVVKRWHDRGRSGWWTLMLAVPFIGWFWGWVELCLVPGVVGPNQYGPDPRQD